MFSVQGVKECVICGTDQFLELMFLSCTVSDMCSFLIFTFGFGHKYLGVAVESNDIIRGCQMNMSAMY